MRRLSQAPAFCYKIQIQLNEIFFIPYENFLLNVFYFFLTMQRYVFILSSPNFFD